ncbi:MULTISPECIES: hypothetical protein [unclassified Paenibacillus]|uniref:hypothetical protein n=1 Tax=unclassified Paenibacillus TaxID=185978 RepID=UPI001AE72F4B|nr:MULTISPECIES: hypothetical protein [unclassified Paenibacillus]MBP1154007.1 hypothetical protein [Paenibacillus sp. PvP091]MBP1170608.1 hypothetical protein [Paenibacillus sp. PvR098]MBP2441636.1 hypothetical protein [Paenibacillus sp. PvP052]
MSIESNTGTNIAQAFKVLLKTYENLDLLFTEMDMEAEEAGLIPLTQRPLRWKSDVHYSGWLINDFIKLYQLKEELSPADEANTSIGAVYGVEVNFEEDYPKLWLIRYTYDFSAWNRLPAVSDHPTFYYPLVDESAFRITEMHGLLKGIPVDDKVMKRYWGIREAVARSIPLVQVSSREAIRNEVFAPLAKLLDGNTDRM